MQVLVFIVLVLFIVVGVSSIGGKRDSSEKNDPMVKEEIDRL